MADAFSSDTLDELWHLAHPWWDDDCYDGLDPMDRLFELNEDEWSMYELAGPGYLSHSSLRVSLLELARPGRPL